VRVHRGEDDYGPRCWTEVQAVACVGMHAGQRGFAPHTLDLSCAWELDGRPLSEADLLLGVAAERGLPAIFLSGDDALDPRGLPFVPTKTALSPVAARSRPMLEVLLEIRQAASGRPVPAPPLAHRPLAIRFRSRWMAERAPARRPAPVGPDRRRAGRPTLEAAIRHGRSVIAAAVAPLGDAYRPWALDEDAAALAGGLRRRQPPGPYRPKRAGPCRPAGPHRVAARATRVAPGRPRAPTGRAALRALTLHMLEAHAPAFFAAQQLAPVLARAQADLAACRRRFPRRSTRPRRMARLDALYVLHERGVDPSAAAAAAPMRPRSALHHGLSRRASRCTAGCWASWPRRSASRCRARS
jgi:D-amino peptidase